MKQIKGLSGLELDAFLANGCDPKPWDWGDPSRSSSDPQQPQAIDLTNVCLINASFRKSRRWWRR